MTDQLSRDTNLKNKRSLNDVSYLVFDSKNFSIHPRSFVYNELITCHAMVKENKLADDHRCFIIVGQR